VDVLIALLLLSLSLLSAGAATLRALQAGHAAALQMRATDLAADRNEDLVAESAAGAAIELSMPLTVSTDPASP
jgi:Tfp pilus assembly protein PilV